MQLDQRQQQVVEHQDGPALVIAGAGAGKTASIIARVVRLVQSGVKPQQILLLTFSRKAAMEMRQRAAKAIGKDAASALAGGTFHVFGSQILRRYFPLCRTIPTNQEQECDLHTLITPNEESQTIDTKEASFHLTLLEPSQTQKLAKDVALETFPEIDKERLPWGLWLHRYELVRCIGITLDRYDDKSIHAYTEAWLHWNRRVWLIPDEHIEEQLTQEMRFARAYEEEKKITNKIDYTDMVNLPMRLFLEHPHIAAAVARRFRYIIVDEAQDTDLAQMTFLYALADHMRKPNIMMVGDDDQTIYAFRGAHPDNLRDFVTRYHPTEIRLEQNYRSTTEIVAASARHITNNLRRLPKAPFSNRSKPDSVTALSHETDREMLDWLVDYFVDQIAKGRSPSEFAVLYRSRTLGPQLSAYLMVQRIPFVIFGSQSFFDAMEIRMTIAVARLIVNPRDTESLRILSPLAPGLGEKNMAAIRRTLRENPGLRIWDAFPRITKPGSKLYRSLADLSTRIHTIEHLGPLQLPTSCWDSEGGLNLMDYFHAIDAKQQKTEKPNLHPRMNKLQLLEEMIATNLADDDPEEPNPWARISNLVVQTPEREEQQDRMVLSTIHACKGMEFPEVHIVGFTAPFLPTIRKNEEPDIEEERRTSYVAMTRAIHKLFLHIPEDFDLPQTSWATGHSNPIFLEESGVPLQEAQEYWQSKEAGKETKNSLQGEGAIPFHRAKW